jgi:glycosyltransferase involved in cell wall biosynthesis
VGDGGAGRIEFERQAALSQAADRIHFEGFQQHPESYMRSAYVFVLPSHRDSFGLVLHEAREAGTAIIATDVDGIPEALDHGRAGLLVPPGNTQALADALRQILSDPKEREKWKAQASIGLSEHTTKRMGEEVISVYRRVLGKPAPEIRVSEAAEQQ